MNGPGGRDRKRVHAINVGVGCDVTIAELASLVAGVVGFKGQIGFAPRVEHGACANMPWNLSVLCACSNLGGLT
jgi:nucleoside-diphosphate-sugar epimerase